MIMLYQNAESVIKKYNKNEKIVDIELKFDTAPFPSITGIVIHFLDSDRNEINIL